MTEYLSGFYPLTYFFHTLMNNFATQTEPTMTVDNVTRVLNKIEGDKWKVMDWFHIPKPLREEIKRRYSTQTHQIQAGVEYYVNCHPCASWEDLTRGLCYGEEFAAARESKSFMSTGKYCHYIAYWYNLKSLLCSLINTVLSHDHINLPSIFID